MKGKCYERRRAGPCHFDDITPSQSKRGSDFQDPAGTTQELLARPPEQIEAPGGDGAVVADDAVEHHLFEFGYGDEVRNEVVFFWVWFLVGMRQALGKEDMLLLVGESVGDPQGTEIGHLLGVEA